MQDTLFHALAVCDTLAPARVYIPRHIWANTTTRTLSQQFEHRLVTIVQAAPTITAATHKTWFDVLGYLGALLADSEGLPLPAEVLSKTLLSAESWGMLKVNKSATGADRWILTYDAAEALLTDPNRGGVLATLLLKQPSSREFPHRHNIGVLRFLAACAEDGLGSVRVDEIGLLVATQPKEGPWKKEVSQLKKLRGEDGNGTMTVKDWERVALNDSHVKKALASSVEVVLSAAPANVMEAEALLRQHSKSLLPGARAARVEELVPSLAPLVLQGDGSTVRETLYLAALAKSVESHCDMVKTALGLLASAGLLEVISEEKNRLYSTRYALTPMGYDALDEFPTTRAPRTYAEARAEQRSTSASAFPDHGKARDEQLQELFAYDSTVEGRACLASKLDWSQYSGNGEASAFEWAVIRSVFAIVKAADGHRHSVGVRTKLNLNLDAVYHAPGGEADAWTRTTNNRTVLIEATGVSGAALVGHELEPVVRHLRNRVKEDKTAVSVFIAPEFSSDMVAYLLTAAAGDPEAGIPPAPVIPITTEQLRGMLKKDISFHDLLDELVVIVAEAAEIPTIVTARKLLEAIHIKVS